MVNIIMEKISVEAILSNIIDLQENDLYLTRWISYMTEGNILPLPSSDVAAGVHFQLLFGMMCLFWNIWKKLDEKGIRIQEIEEERER